MEELASEVAKQIPSLVGLGLLVWVFLDHMKTEAKAAREERAAERGERAMERQSLHAIVERNSNAHERAVGMMTHIEMVLRRIEGDEAAPGDDEG